jgi:hypothetical protein
LSYGGALDEIFPTPSHTTFPEPDYFFDMTFPVWRVDKPRGRLRRGERPVRLGTTADRRDALAQQIKVTLDDAQHGHHHAYPHGDSGPSGECRTFPDMGTSIAATTRGEIGDGERMA